MKKQISIANQVHTVETVEELLALNIKLADMVAYFNQFAGADHQVKKFSDKPAAAKRLLTVLPEEPKVEIVAKTQPGSVKTILRELFADPQAAYTMEELLEKCGCSKRVLSDDISRLKNAGYCGKAGLLVIERCKDLGDRYVNAIAFNPENEAVADALYDKYATDEAKQAAVQDQCEDICPGGVL